jgi:hypothetical protein
MEPGGCAIFENYITPTALSPGRSVSFYNTDDGRWYQTYVDAGGNLVRLGSTIWSAQQLIFVSPPPGALTRTTWTLNLDGTVRQFIEASGNNGQTWIPSFDLLYRRK